jgi:hypothetical protein
MLDLGTIIVLNVDIRKGFKLNFESGCITGHRPSGVSSEAVYRLVQGYGKWVQNPQGRTKWARRHGHADHVQECSAMHKFQRPWLIHSPFARIPS